MSATMKPTRGEDLAKSMLRSRTETRLTAKQAKYLADVLRRELGDEYRQSGRMQSEVYPLYVWNDEGTDFRAYDLVVFPNGGGLLKPAAR